MFFLLGILKEIFEKFMCLKGGKMCIKCYSKSLVASISLSMMHKFEKLNDVYYLFIMDGSFLGLLKRSL